MGKSLRSGIFTICFGAALILAGCAGTPNEPQLAEGMALRAAAFRSQKRLSADGKIPADAVLTAVRQREALVDSSDANGVFPGGWTAIGPGNIGGRVRMVIIHPTNTNIMWTAGCSGGIWKTTDGGANWVPLNDFLPVLPVQSMALDPTNPNILYAGTGEGFFETVEGSSNTAAVRGAGIFKTVDGGTTWTHLSNTSGPQWYFVNRIAISPTNSSVILAATNSGIWRSTDAGNSWTNVETEYAYDVQFHPTDGTKAVAGFHDIGVKYTTDGGQTWISSTGDGDPHRSEVRYSRSSPTTVYSAAADADRIKIYRSTNGGASFSLVTTGSGISCYSAYNVVLWVDPTNANSLIVGGVNLYRSTNSGGTFTQGFNNVHADMHAIESDPGYNGTTNRRVFFGTDGGIYRANDSTSNTVTTINTNLAITQFYGAVMNPANNNVVGGTQDNGTLRYTGNPLGWVSVFGGDGVYCEYDPTDVNYWYGGIYYAQIFRSTTGGPNGSYIYNGIADAGNAATCNFVAFFMLDPNNANTMLVGARSLWRSTNVKAGTPTWTAIKPTIQPRPTNPPPVRTQEPVDAHFAPNPPWNISTIAVAQGNSDIIWLGYNNGEVWRTSNGTAATPTWTRVDNGANPLPDRWVGSIRIDPSNHSRVLIGFMGYDPDNLWITSNSGANWSDISGNLPSAPISAVTTHQSNWDWIYVGTDVGLFTSADGGSNWITTNQGPAVVPVEELRWVTPTKLLCVTHGRGIYTATVANALDHPMSPFGYTIVIGTYGGGFLHDLFASDDRRLIVNGDFISSDFATPASVQFTTTSPITTPVSLRFKVEAQTSEAQLGQRILLYNWMANSWEEVGFNLSTLADQTVEITINSNPARFINQTTREMRARVTWEPFISESSVEWVARIDQVLWTVTGS